MLFFGVGANAERERVFSCVVMAVGSPVHYQALTVLVSQEVQS